MLHQRTRPLPDAESFLHTSHVADLLHVSPKTIARWADGRRSLEPAIRELAASLAQGVRAS